MGPAGSRGAGGTWLLFGMLHHVPMEVLALSQTTSSGAVLHSAVKRASCSVLSLRGHETLLL